MSAVPPLDAATESLFAAVRAHDMQAIDAALAAGVDINGEEAYEILIDRTWYDASRTALMLALQLGRPDVARRLLEVPGIDVDRGDRFAGQTALMLAARKGERAIVEMLLAAGADPNRMDKYDVCLAATYAIREIQSDIAIRLIEAGTDLSRHGHDLLTEATRYGLHAAVAALTARGVEPLKKKEARRAIAGDWPKPGPPPEPAPSISDEALFRAAEEGDAKLLRIATSWGLALNRRRAGGETPLMAAIRCGQSQAAMILIEGGADIRLRKDDGEDALALAERLQRSYIAAALRRKLRPLA